MGGLPPMENMLIHIRDLPGFLGEGKKVLEIIAIPSSTAQSSL